MIWSGGKVPLTFEKFPTAHGMALKSRFHMQQAKLVRVFLPKPVPCTSLPLHFSSPKFFFCSFCPFLFFIIFFFLHFLACMAVTFHLLLFHYSQVAMGFWSLISSSSNAAD